MKNILLATTALVATAGFAAADVTMSGHATFGAISVDGSDFELESDIDLYVTGTTETDGGLTLTATVEMEDLGGAGYNKTSGANVTQTIVSVAGGFGTLTFGNTDGALDKNLTESFRIYRGIDFEGWGGRVDNADNGEILRYDYSANGFNVSLSYAGADDAFGIGASWKGEVGNGMQLSAGIGYEDGDLGDLFGASVGIDVNNFGARLAYWDGSEGNREQLDLGLQYSANGLTVGAEYLMNESADTDNYTVFVTYDLGGGANVFAQHGTRDMAIGAETDFTSFGLNFSF